MVVCLEEEEECGGMRVGRYREYRGVGSLEGGVWQRLRKVGVGRQLSGCGRGIGVRFQGVRWEEWICWETFPFSYPSELLVPGSFLQNLERTPCFLVLRSLQLFCSRG